MLRRFVPGFLILGLAAPLARANSDFLNNTQWKNYVVALNFYQHFYPNVYQALELLPLEKIPLETFNVEISQSGQAWSEAERKKQAPVADRQNKIQVSRGANERLIKLLFENQSHALTTYKAVLEKIPEEYRSALTPLDPMFWNSVVGSKIKSDFKRSNSDPALIEKVLIRSEKGYLDFVLSAEKSYRLKIISKDESSLRLKGDFMTKGMGATDAETNPDGALKIFDLVGAFYNRKAGTELPFGPYPQKDQIHLGEGGNAHFAGDGHQHFFDKQSK